MAFSCACVKCRCGHELPWRFDSPTSWYHPSGDLEAESHLRLAIVEHGLCANCEGGIKDIHDINKVLDRADRAFVLYNTLRCKLAYRLMDEVFCPSDRMFNDIEYNWKVKVLRKIITSLGCYSFFERESQWSCSYLSVKKERKAIYYED